MQLNRHTSIPETIGYDTCLMGGHLQENPNTPGTAPYHLWRLGFFKAEYEDPILQDERDLDAEIRKEGELLDEENALLELQRRAESATPRIETVANTIGVPTNDWAARCYEIASAIADAGLVEGRAVFGHYHGFVSQHSPFADRPIVQHGWIEFDDGVVLDPTRWVFENTAPYLYVTSNINGDYDRGGQKMLLARMSDPPAHDPAKANIAIDTPRATAQWLEQTLQQTRDTQSRITITREQAFWLANMPVDMMGAHAPAIHDALEATGCKGLIPTDMWEMSREQKQRTFETEPETPTMAMG